MTKNLSSQKISAIQKKWQREYRQLKIERTIAAFAALDTDGKRHVLDALVNTDVISLHAVVPKKDENGEECLHCVPVEHCVTNGETIDLWLEGAMDI